MNDSDFLVRFVQGLKYIELEFLNEHYSSHYKYEIIGEFLSYEKELILEAIDFKSIEREGKDLLQFSLPNCDRPLRKVYLYLYDINNIQQKNILFDNLCPVNDSEFNKQFIRKVQRTRYPQLDYYVASQILKFFSGSDCYRCSSAVVKAYKAVEMNKNNLLEDALRSVDKSLELCLKIPEDWHPRRNGIHLYFSLLCARWHLCLALEDKEEFIKSVVSAIDKSKQFNSSSFHTAGYPISLSISIKVLFDSLVKSGNPWSDSDYCAQVFKKAVEDSDPRKITLFDELKVSHRATLVCMMIAGEKTDLENTDKLFEFFSSLIRVRGKAAERLFRNFIEVSKK